jgi:hypothetical protein
MAKNFLELTLPLSVMLPRKKTPDKRYPLNLNIYRNTHHMTLNEAKAAYSEIIKSQLAGIGLDTLPKLVPPVYLLVTLWTARKCDLANVASVVEKFFADSIVECQVLADDNCTIITGGGYEFGGYDKINPRAVVRISER